MEFSEEIAGEWVHNKDMHPHTNIYGRRWMAAGSGYEGVYMGQGSFPPGISKSNVYWYFPASETITSHTGVNRRSGIRRG